MKWSMTFLKNKYFGLICKCIDYICALKILRNEYTNTSDGTDENCNEIKK